MAFPNFHGREKENASDFLDDLEMAFLVSRRDEDPVKLRAFPLVRLRIGLQAYLLRGRVVGKC